MSHPFTIPLKVKDGFDEFSFGFPMKYLRALLPRNDASCIPQTKGQRMRFWSPKSILSVMATLTLSAIHMPAFAQDFCAPSEVSDPQALHINGSKPFVYKSIGGADLRLHVFSPPGHKAEDKTPAAVFFYGGGFVFGDVRRYQTQATHLALLGMVTVLVDYRVRCRNKSTIMDSVADGKSAMRWVRGHATQLGIDPSRIAVVGSSAGGQMAAATALIPGFNDPKDPDVDPRPNALVLYNPALDMVAIADRLEPMVGKESASRARELSPWEYLAKGKLPPTIIFQGAADTATTQDKALQFCKRAKSLKFQCDVVIYPGAPHGFTEPWIGLDDPKLGIKYEEWAWDAIRRSDGFFRKLGWLPAKRR